MVGGGEGARWSQHWWASHILNISILDVIERLIATEQIRGVIDFRVDT